MGLLRNGLLTAGAFLLAAPVAHASEDEGGGFSLSLTPRIGYVQENLSGQQGDLDQGELGDVGGVVVGSSSLYLLPSFGMVVTGGTLGVNTPSQSVAIRYFSGSGETTAYSAGLNVGDGSMGAGEAVAGTVESQFDRQDVEISYLRNLTSVSSLVASARYEILEITQTVDTLYICLLSSPQGPNIGCFTVPGGSPSASAQSITSLRVGGRAALPLGENQLSSESGLRPILIGELYGVAEQVKLDRPLEEPLDGFRPGVDFSVGAVLQLGAATSLDARLRNQWSAATSDFTQVSRTSFMVGLTFRP